MHGRGLLLLALQWEGGLHSRGGLMCAVAWLSPISTQRCSAVPARRSLHSSSSGACQGRVRRCANAWRIMRASAGPDGEPGESGSGENPTSARGDNAFGEDDQDGFLGTGLSPWESAVTILGLNPLTVLLAVAALGMVLANVVLGPGWLRPLVGLGSAAFKTRNLVLPLDQPGFMVPDSLPSDWE